MQFSLGYRLGDTLLATDIREFPDAQTADAACIAVGEFQNDSAEVTWRLHRPDEHFRRLEVGLSKSQD